MNEYEVRKVPLGNTRAAGKMLQELHDLSYEPFISAPHGNNLIIIFRIKRKPGRPPKQESEE